jgi:hypothetical protein
MSQSYVGRVANLRPIANRPVDLWKLVRTDWQSLSPHRGPH